MKAMAINEYPEGAPELNDDGTINCYDGRGKKVGTVSTEEVKAAMEKITEIETEDGKTIPL